MAIIPFRASSVQKLTKFSSPFFKADKIHLLKSSQSQLCWASVSVSQGLATENDTFNFKVLSDNGFVVLLLLAAHLLGNPSSDCGSFKMMKVKHAGQLMYIVWGNSEVRCLLQELRL